MVRQACRAPLRSVVDTLDTVRVFDEPVEFLACRFRMDGRLLERRRKKPPNAIERSGRMTGRHAQTMPTHGSRKDRRNVSAASPEPSVQGPSNNGGEHTEKINGAIFQVGGVDDADDAPDNVTADTD